MSALSEFRAAKDDFFRTDHQSPLQPQQQSQFDGLNYYDENEALSLGLEPVPLETVANQLDSNLLSKKSLTNSGTACSSLGSSPRTISSSNPSRA